MRKIAILSLLIVIFCIGCSKDTAVNNQQSNINSDVPIQSSNTEIIQNKGESPNTNVTSKEDKSSMSETIELNIPKEYVDFIKNKVDISDKETMLLFIMEDIDLDGKQEAIIATGVQGGSPSESYVSHTFVVRKVNDRLVQIGEDLAALGGYGIYEVKLISLQNSPQKYIYCGLTNGASLFGFRVIELKGEQLVTVCESASGTGAGEDALEDYNKDGLYDGYSENRWSYDVLYIPVTRLYKLQNKEFVLNSTSVDIPEYPKNAKDVVVQYLSLITLDVKESTEAAERLSELCTAQEGQNSDFFNNLHLEIMYNTIQEFEDGIKFIIDENGDSAVITAAYEDENKKKYTCRFQLIKADDRWHIEKMDEMP